MMDCVVARLGLLAMTAPIPFDRKRINRPPHPTRRVARLSQARVSRSTSGDSAARTLA
jgi:hypothetical protein